MCGGTTIVALRSYTGPGLSPRVRGNHTPDPEQLIKERSIPACAGEPDYARLRFSDISVYPRVCGGTLVAKVEARKETGLSPRVRGNRHAANDPVAGQGSIPACAGEPPLWTMSTLAPRVYPRVCGGTRI